MTDFSIPYNVLCEVLFDRDNSLERFLQEQFSLQDDQILKIVSEINKKFVPHFNQKLKSVHRIRTKFREKYSRWMEGMFTVNLSGNLENRALSSNRSGGRPKKAFEECSNRAKRYKIEELRETHSQELIDAAALPMKDSADTAFTADSALALITQAKLSKYQYEILRKATQNIGYDIFPNYTKIIEAKKNCYPNNIEITEKSAKVGLQDLLDHTSRRILNTKTQVDIEALEEDHLTLHTKWGCDGASGQSEYMQKFSNPSMDLSDSNLFMTSIVPLKMTLETTENLTNLVWKNSRPSSTRYCRALKFEFTKETPP